MASRRRGFAGERGVGALERGEPLGLEVGGERRLVELHPLHAEILQARQHAGIGLSERVDELQAVEARLRGLGQAQE